MTQKNSYTPKILRPTPEKAISTRSSKWDDVIAHCKAHPGESFDVLEDVAKPVPTPDAMKRAGVKLRSRRTPNELYTMSAVYVPETATPAVKLAAVPDEDLF